MTNNLFIALKENFLINFTTLFVTFTLNIVSNNLHAQKNTFFEGTVTYKIEYTPLKKDISVERIEQAHGSKMTFTIKNGFTEKKYFTGSGKLLQTRIFNPNDNLNILYNYNSDTGFQYHPSINTFKTIEFTQLKDSVMDGITLEGIKVKVEPINNPHSYAMTFWYYFDRKLKVDPTKYEKFKEGDWDKVIAQKKSVCYYMAIDNGYSFIATYKAVNISPHVVDSKIYNIPEKLFLKNVD